MRQKIIFGSDLMKRMGLFEKITRAKLKDCFDDELTGAIVFIVQENEIGKAIGKKGSNIKRLEEIFKKKIKIVEYSDEMISFISNLLYPLKASDIREEDGKIVVVPIDMKTRGIMIGRNAQNLRNLEKQVRRHFNLQEICIGQPNN